MSTIIGLKRIQKDNADTTGYFSYLRNEVARRIVDRIRVNPIFNYCIIVYILQDIKREFPVCVDLGCGHGHIYRQLTPGLGSIQKFIQIDSSLKTVLHNKHTQTECENGEWNLESRAMPISNFVRTEAVSHLRR